ncbi:MAG TPA: hypothetical protein DEP84_27905, partial [Chloroflexi bacterium]|nr:hypothetical protein [Chloroflexota bacterium]
MGHIRRVVAVLAVALLLGAIGVQQRDLILAARTVLPSPSSIESGEAPWEAPVAANTATLSLNAPADPVTVGETFTVTVGVSDLSEPLAAFQFDLGYDSTILRFVRMEAGGGLRATGRSVV